MSVTINVPTVHHFAPRALDDGNLKLALEAVGYLPKPMRPSIRAVKDYGNRASRAGALSSKVTFEINPRSRDPLRRINNLLMETHVTGLLFRGHSRVLDRPCTYVEFSFREAKAATLFRLYYRGEVR
jgi:hypothetical protein